MSAMQPRPTTLSSMTIPIKPLGLQHQRDRRAFFTSDERQPLVRRQARGQIFFSQFIFSQFTCVVSLPICS